MSMTPERAGDEDSPAAVEKDIERTRRHMSRSIDALEEKLEPGRLLTDAFANFKKSVLGEEGSRQVIETIRANPIAAALTVIGVGWLALGARSRSNGNGGSAGSQDWGGMRSRMSDSYDRARDGAGGAYDSGREAVGKATTYTSRQAGRAGHYVTEHPLAFGAAAVALGAVVGALLPTSRLEESYAGEFVDSAMEKAGETGREFVQKAQEVAENAGRAAADSVKEAIDPPV